MVTPLDAVTAAARFGMPEQWGRYHQGHHVCVDGRNYTAYCLVTHPDPAVERVARYFMTRNASPQGGANA